MSILANHNQSGQYVYQEKVTIAGKLKRSISVHVLGPNWKRSHVEITPTEAVYLGLKIHGTKTGDISGAAPCTITGPNGSVKLDKGAIIPRPHLTCSTDDARRLHLVNGQLISVEILGEKSIQIYDVIVRVHPTFRLRIELHQDYARDLWITRPIHARIIN